MRQVSWLFACVVSMSAAGAAACAAPSVPMEGHGSSRSHIEGGRYNPNEAAPQQPDKWSCSVHTTTWMLRATGNDHSIDAVSSYMLDHRRVTMQDGLSDASGAGLAQTLRELAEGSPSIGSTGSTSFDEVAARAGKMAIGIGGRAWNHWSGVRGYDAQADVLLLANSAVGFMRVGETMTREDFDRLGAMSMVWMDYGDGARATPASPAPTTPSSSRGGSSFVPATRPVSHPFPPLEVRASVSAAVFVTQCNVEATAERVWQTDGRGPSPDTSWAPPKYPQEARQSCGAAGADGIHPLVFRSLRAGVLHGAWIVQCSGYGDGAQHVFRVDGEVEGHPSASFLYNEPNPDCD